MMTESAKGVEGGCDDNCDSTGADATSLWMCLYQQ